MARERGRPSWSVRLGKDDPSPSVGDRHGGGDARSRRPVSRGGAGRRGVGLIEAPRNHGHAVDVDAGLRP
jgi:hypothetical protein